MAGASPSLASGAGRLVEPLVSLSLFWFCIIEKLIQIHFSNKADQTIHTGPKEARGGQRQPEPSFSSILLRCYVQTIPKLP